MLIVGFWAMLELVPMPADDCPCFDDAVLSGAVALGSLLGRWAVGVRDRSADIIMPGSGWAFSKGEWVRVPGDAVLWWEIAALKMLVGQCAASQSSMSILISSSSGIVLVFTWRMIAKAALQRLLRVLSPPSRQKLGVGNKIIYRHRSDSEFFCALEQCSFF